MYGSIFSQQNEEFKSAKHYFNAQKSMLNYEFSRKLKSESDSLRKNQIYSDYEEFMTKLDSIENKAYLASLVKVKNMEDLQEIRIHQNPEASHHLNPFSGKITKPEYPGGMEKLRQQITELFYADAFTDYRKEFRTRISFLVNETGQITQVNAEGDDILFNTQATIAVYLLPEKFQPATLKGKPVKYEYHIPVFLKFD